MYHVFAHGLAAARRHMPCVTTQRLLPLSMPHRESPLVPMLAILAILP